MPDDPLTKDIDQLSKQCEEIAWKVFCAERLARRDPRSTFSYGFLAGLAFAAKLMDSGDKEPDDVRH